jgi:hypothetical protein
LYTGPGGGLNTGPGGGLYRGPGGGLYTSADPNPYYSNIPPREVYLQQLLERGHQREYEMLKTAWRL